MNPWTCVYCGMQNELLRLSCHSCGAPRQPKLIEQPKQPKVATPKPAPSPEYLTVIK